MRSLFVTACACLIATSARAQFDSGATGELGDVVIATDTAITLPADGVLDYASLTLQPGVRVTFVANGANTPVFVLAEGDIVIGDGAVIDLSGGDGGANGVGGRGGPGGFDGGAHVDDQVQASAGQGPGAGKSNPSGSGGNGGYAMKGGGALVAFAGPTYGSPLLLPLVGGSGGAGGTGHGGGGGGGAILLASDTRVVFGDGAVVRARGGAGFGGYQTGSGGAVRVVAPSVEGPGTVDVGSGGSGHGFARVDTLQPAAVELTVPSGRFAVGSLMVSFLEDEPRLDLVGLGQASIPLDHDGEFLVVLPAGDTTQDLSIALSGFVGIVPLRIALTPDVGDQVLVDVEVDAGAGADATFDLPLTFPANVGTVVRVWTRPAS